MNATIWEDDPEKGGDDLMDQFIISLPASAPDLNQCHILNVPGQYGIGTLTVAYFNLTTDPVTSCSSVDSLSK